MVDHGRLSRTARRSFLALAIACGQVAPQFAMAQEPASPVRGSLTEDLNARKLLQAGDARYAGDEATKAVEVWQSVIERYPRSRVRFDAQMRIGAHLLERERAYDRARTYFEAAAVEENPDQNQRAEATLKMGVCFYEARNHGKAFSVLREVVEKFPTSPQVNPAYYYIGLGHFQLGHYSRAIDALEKVGTALGEEGAKSEKVEAGKRLFLKIEDADLAALAADQTVKVKCRTRSGDEELVECLPVGRNVRIVLGSIITGLGKAQPGNNRLEVAGDDEVSVTYVDSHTANQKFNEERLSKVKVVADGVSEIMDGAFEELLRGVVLGRQVNVQITDLDRDLTDQAETIKAAVEVYREKTLEELDNEADKSAAGGKPVLDLNDPEAKIDRLKLIDRVEVTLVETAIRPSAVRPAGEVDPAAEAPPKALPETKTEDTKSGPAKTDATKTETNKEAPSADGEGAGFSSGSSKGDSKKQPAKTPAKSTAPTSDGTAAEQTPADTGIHTGIFRAAVSLNRADQVIAGNDALEARPGDIVRVVYLDERHLGELPATRLTSASCVDGTLGGVRVTRAEISDEELRIQTQLKTASALTNIGNRYKEFGLKKNADAKYGQALAVCEEILDDARRLGGRLLEETYVQLWQVYYEMDKLELAANMSQRLQREFPNSEFVDDALLKLADVVRKQGDLRRAIGIYNRLVGMQGSQLRGEGQFGIAECYEKMALDATEAGQEASARGLYDQAFQQYKLVFDNFPDSGRVGEAVAKMANYYYQQKDYARAVDTFETVLGNHPDAKFLDVILFNYGRCLYRMERKAEARKQFDQLIGDFPESPLAADAKKIAEALGKAGF